MLTPAMGLKGEEKRRLEREVRLGRAAVVPEDLLAVEEDEGEEERGVDKSEPEEDWFEAIGGGEVMEERVRCDDLGGELLFMIISCLGRRCSGRALPSAACRRGHYMDEERFNYKKNSTS